MGGDDAVVRVHAYTNAPKYTHSAAETDAACVHRKSDLWQRGDWAEIGVFLAHRCAGPIGETEGSGRERHGSLWRRHCRPDQARQFRRVFAGRGTDRKAEVDVPMSFMLNW